MSISTFFFFLPFILTYVVFVVYAERKIAGFIQDRLGPMEVGYYGILQTVADILKIIQKEDIIHQGADRKLFKIAPVIIFVAVFAGFSVIPLTPYWTGANINTGLFFMLAIVSLDVIGILMAGWSAQSKFTRIGAMRGVAQIISYEIPLGLSVLSVAMISQSLNLQEISYQQGTLSSLSQDMLPNYLFGIKALGIETTHWGGFLTWNIFRAPILLITFIIYFIASLAECNRTPFDLPEAESELIGGFHTEYSGFRWSLTMLSEYGMMLLTALLGVILFWGAWNTPLPNIGSWQLAHWTTGTPGSWTSHVWGLFWLLSKACIFIFVQIWVRWTYPRLRVDQLMGLAWKYLTPLALIGIFLAALWRVFMI